MLEELKDSNIVIYGSEKQRKDLQYVFRELNIVAGTQDIKQLFGDIRRGYFAVICGQEQTDVLSLLQKNDFRQGTHYCTDDELIAMLNFPLDKMRRGKQVMIWGTGYCCEQLESTMAQRGMTITVDGYIDNDCAKVGTKKNGHFIFTSEGLNPDEHYVIIAAGYENYVAMRKELENRGFTSDSFSYYRTVMDDVAGHFRKTYDSHDYFDTMCPNRDNSVRIAANGDVCTCCMSYQSIYGNLFEHTFEDIWNSKRARIGRLALDNRTYVFCDTIRCPFLAHLEKKDIGEESYKKIEYQTPVNEYPDSVAPEVDTNCNLYCTSCRNEIHMENNSYIDCYTDMVLDKLVSLPTRFIINTVGEPLASRNCLRILHNEKTRKRKQISIYTNGTLLSPKKLDELLAEYETIELAVSVDAATKKTYEVIRRNGNFDHLIENLSYISKKRKQNRVTHLQMNYVLQVANVMEMEQFVHWAEELGADRVAINAIEQWAVFTDEEFEKVSVLENGKVKAPFRKYFTKELIEDEKINFHNLANAVGAVPKLMYMI